MAKASKPFAPSRRVKAAPPPHSVSKADQIKIDQILNGKKHYDESTSHKIRARGPVKSKKSNPAPGRGIRSNNVGRGRESGVRHKNSKPKSFMQRAIVQVSYSAMRGTNKSGAWKAHARYLLREGTEREDGRGGEGFDAEKEGVDLVNLVDSWAQAGDERMFKFVFSPERGDAVDLKKVTRAFMESVEKDLQTKLQWGAVDHYNTDNPHVHIVVRGVDENGKPLQIAPIWIKNRARQIASEVMTAELGYRSEQDIKKALERSVTVMVVTPMDRSIRARMDQSPDGQTVAFVGPAKNAVEQDKRILEIRRLKYLETCGIAEYMGHTSWRVSANFEKIIKQNQILHDRTKSLHHMNELLTEPNAALQYRPKLDLGEWVMGRVIGGGFDERRDRPFFAVEGIDHKLHMLDASPALEKMRVDGRIKNGDLIALRRVEKEIVRKDKDGQETPEKIQTFTLYRWGLVDRKTVPESAVWLAHAWELEKNGAGLQAPTTGPEGFAKAFHALASRELAKNPALTPDAAFRKHEETRARELSMTGEPLTWKRDPDGQRKDAHDLVGRVLWKGQTAVLIQGIDNGHFLVDSPEFGRMTPRVGADVWIRAKNPKMERSKFDDRLATYIERKGEFIAADYERGLQMDIQIAKKNGRSPSITPEELTKMAIRRLGTWERVGVKVEPGLTKAQILERLDAGFAEAKAKAAQKLPWGKIEDKHLADKNYMRRLVTATEKIPARANINVARAIEKARADQKAARQMRLDLTQSRSEGAGR